MLKVVYVGPDWDLKFKTALARTEDYDDSIYLCQFDDKKLKQAFGWWGYPKRYFISYQSQLMKAILTAPSVKWWHGLCARDSNNGCAPYTDIMGIFKRYENQVGSEKPYKRKH